MERAKDFRRMDTEQNVKEKTEKQGHKVDKERTQIQSNYSN